MSAPDAPTTAMVVHPFTGQVVDLVDARTEDLAEALVELADIRGRLKDWEALLHREVLGRLDRGAKWTVKVPGRVEGSVVTLSAPSPQAGGEAYDADDLLPVLRDLVADGVVDADAAAGALVRTVTVSFAVGLDDDLDDLVGTLSRADDVAGVPVAGVAAVSAQRVHLPAVKALRKVPGAAEALDEVRRDVPAPDRRVKASVKVPNR